MSYKPFKMKGSPFQRNFGTKRPVLDRGGSLFKYKDEGHFLEKDQTGAPYEKGESDCAECKGKPADCKCPEKYPLGMEDPKYREKIYKKTEVERK